MSQALNILRSRFGYDEFRFQQQQIIDNLIEGRDALVLMPTGVAVYETSSGDVLVAHMNFRLMRHMFSGVVKKALSQSAYSLENALSSIDVT